MRVYFTEKDFKGIFLDPRSCPISRALKRLGFKEPYTTYNDVTVGKRNNRILLELKGISGSAAHIEQQKDRLSRGKKAYFEIKELTCL